MESQPNSPASSHIWLDDSDEEQNEADTLSDAGFEARREAYNARMASLENEANQERVEEPDRKKRRTTSYDAERLFTEVACRSVDSFKRLNKIDEGGYGVVYRVENRRTKEQFALKKVKMRGDLKAEGFPVTALREVDHLLSVHHRNIVNVYETVVGNTRDDVFLVMEFVEHDLKTLMEQRGLRFTSPQVKCIALQVLEAINYLHSHWILHRDLKTNNILINNNGVLKICDFGMARSFGDPLQPSTPLNQVVTLPYRPPEGLMAGSSEYPFGPASDMWSVGCIFAELLQNRMLFRPTNEFDLLNKMCQLLGTPNDETWPGWSDLEFAKKWTVKDYKAGELRKRFPQAGSSFDGSKVYLTEKGGFDLLSSLLAMCPERRISAESCLQHLYFKEVPQPDTEADLAKILSKIPSMHLKEKKR